MKKLIAIMLMCVCVFSLSSCGEPAYKGPASYYDERVSEDVLSACGCLEDAKWALSDMYEYLCQSVDDGVVPQEVLEAVEGYMAETEKDIDKAWEHLGY